MTNQNNSKDNKFQGEGMDHNVQREEVQRNTTPNVNEPQTPPTTPDSAVSGETDTAGGTNQVPSNEGETQKTNPSTDSKLETDVEAEGDKNENN